jgi:hypothetical protein
MRAVMTIEAGEGRGRRMWLLSHQVASVGSSPCTDFVVTGDSRLAEIHFRLETSTHGCRLRCFREDRPVWVNGAEVSGEQMLETGDVITAGATRFRVLLEGVAAVQSPAGPQQARLSSPTVEAVSAGIGHASSRMSYSAEVCASGLTRFVGNGREQDFVGIVRQLACRHPLHLVVNFRRARVPVPERLGPDRDLLRHLSDRPSARGQLMLISPTDERDWLERLPSLLGKDAVCCVFSDKPKHELMHGLRPVAISYSAPSILDGQLSTCPDRFVRGVLAPVSALALEAPDGKHWRAYGHPDTARTWQEMGFPDSPARSTAGGDNPGR